MKFRKLSALALVATLAVTGCSKDVKSDDSKPKSTTTTTVAKATAKGKVWDFDASKVLVTASEVKSENPETVNPDDGLLRACGLRIDQKALDATDKAGVQFHDGDRAFVQTVVKFKTTDAAAEFYKNAAELSARCASILSTNSGVGDESMMAVSQAWIANATGDQEVVIARKGNAVFITAQRPTSDQNNVDSLSAISATQLAMQRVEG
jgi:hypothetical protein